jgi:hypothetical protein
MGCKRSEVQILSPRHRSPKQTARLNALQNIPENHRGVLFKTASFWQAIFALFQHRCRLGKSSPSPAPPLKCGSGRLKRGSGSIVLLMRHSLLFFIHPLLRRKKDRVFSMYSKVSLQLNRILGSIFLPGVKKLGLSNIKGSICQSRHDTSRHSPA